MLFYYRWIWKELCAASFLKFIDYPKSGHANASNYRAVIKVVDVKDMGYTSNDNKRNSSPKVEFWIKINGFFYF